MKRITIQVSETTVASLCELAKRCTAANAYSGGFTSHGPLTVASLLAMLAEDAGMVITRPGSWEGANMAQVFSSHGYEV
ncbi:MAG: hypothetical protein LBI87_10075 [Candidatus Accumulibacter sp.]|jgi:hypothetical protein|nr:hypothetical protein [Accumulibacter sp.]